ncbi:MAG: fructose-6-phosphate aldolase [Peptococcaceae bacterium]|jgi:transaldolase|nr:fructose-6-phosphate aldolase [Peptococcaceae bacterium]
MELFIDSANVEEIRQAWSMGLIAGVTTNPTLIAKEGIPIERRLREILAVVTAGPINGEAMGSQAAELVKQGKALAAMDPRIVVKIPITGEGLKAIRELREEGVKTNATLAFTAAQCLAAARAGASYISPFLGRLDDAGRSRAELLGQCQDIWRNYDLTARLIAASIRSVEHVVEAARHGWHIATVPYTILLAMLRDPLTDVGIKRFEADWAAAGLTAFQG